MKRMKGTKIIAGALIPTILFPSCSGFYCDSDLITINKEMDNIESLNSVLVPINMESTSEEQKVMNFLYKLRSCFEL